MSDTSGTGLPGDTPYRMPPPAATDEWRKGTPAANAQEELVGQQRSAAALEAGEAKYQGQMSPLKAGVARGYQDLSKATANPPQQQPLPPRPDAREYEKNSMAFASAMAVLGAVSSHFGLVNTTGALSAFGGALKGWQEGNLSNYEEAAKKWEQDTKATVETNRQLMQKYQAVLDSKHLNIDGMMAQISLIAAENHHDIMYQAAQANNYTLAAKIKDKMWEYTDGPNGVEAAAAPFLKDRRVQEAKQADIGSKLVSGEINPDDTDPQTGQPRYTDAQKMYFKDTKDRYLNGFYGTPGGGKGGTGFKPGSKEEMITRRNAELAAEGKPPMTAMEEKQLVASQPRSAQGMSLQKYMQENPDATSDDLRRFQAEQQGLNAEERAVGQRAGAIGLAVNEVDKTIPNVLAAAEKSAGKGYATWNGIENRWKVEKGDADFAFYVQQMNSLVNIYGRVISGGGKGTVSDLEHARQMLNPNMPLSAVKGALRGFSTEIDIAEKAPEEVRQKMRGAGPTPAEPTHAAPPGGAVEPSKMSDDDLKKKLGL